MESYSDTAEVALAFGGEQMKFMRDSTLVILTVFAVMISFPIAAAGEKLKPEELIQKHLDSIGNMETIRNVTARSVWGQGAFRIVVGGDGNLFGTASLLSEGRKLRFSLDFDYPQYLGERITYDTNKIRVSRIVPSGRSRLGSFLYTYNQIIREGLLGSCLSTAWPLLDVKGRRAKLKYRGLKNIDGKKLHRLSYRPRKKGGDIRITLYFEQETFRHVRTDYNVLIRSGVRSNPNLSTASDETYKVNRFLLVETFDDFRSMDGLTLPTLWSMRYSQEKEEGDSLNSAGLVVEYTMSLPNISHGQTVNPKVFLVSENPDAFQKQE